MKKILTLLIIGLTTITVNAQFSFGVHADAFFSYGSITRKDQSDPSRDFVVAGKAGVIASVHLTKKVFFVPELNVATRTTKFSGATDACQASYSSEATVKPVFVEVPLNVSFHKSVRSGSFFIGISLVISVGVTEIGFRPKTVQPMIVLIIKMETLAAANFV